MITIKNFGFEPVDAATFTGFFQVEYASAKDDLPVYFLQL